MPLGTEVGLGQGDFVLNGNPATPKGDTTPNFWPMAIAQGSVESLPAAAQSYENRISNVLQQVYDLKAHSRSSEFGYPVLGNPRWNFKRIIGIRKLVSVGYRAALLT